MSETYSTVLTRPLRIRAEREGGKILDLVLEIGFPTNVETSEPLEGYAGFRVSPLTDWNRVYGVDAIQAVYLAIQLAEQEAERIGAVWPDEASDL